jgi:hypothetical protein
MHPHPLEEGRIPMSVQQGFSLTLESPPIPQGNGQCSPDVLYDLLSGLLSRSAWSGIVLVHVDNYIKKLYICSGELVFARSNLMDDRLGEVIYRKGLINLEELLQSTTQVTRERRFGQVLLSSQIFQEKTLWEALKAQIHSIIVSVFMAENVSYELQPLDSYEFHLSFPDSSTLLKDAYLYGVLYRNFISRLDFPSNPSLTLTSDAQIQLTKERGTFLSDMLSLVQTTQFMTAFLETSKLIQSYSMAALMDLYKKNYVQLGSLGASITMAQKDSELFYLVECYNLLVKKIAGLYRQDQLLFPINQLKEMAESLNKDKTFGIFIDGEGALSPCTLEDWAIVMRSFPEKEGDLGKKSVSLLRYLLQIAGDRLSRKNMEPIYQDYRKIFEKLKKQSSYQCP